MGHIPYTFIASYIVLFKNNQVLLQKRFNTGFEDGQYSLPAGHVEKEENFTAALLRETAEEIGIRVIPEKISVAHIMHRKTPDRNYVDTFFVCQEWEGDITNLEPNKCDDLSGFPLESLPQNTIPYITQALQSIKDATHYSEFGWDT